VKVSPRELWRRAALAGLRPPERLPLSAWLEGHLRLPQGLAAEPGPIKLWPYQRGIADALNDPQIERVSIVKPTRVGFTTLLTGLLGHHVVNDPAPVLMVLPTQDDCRDAMVSDIEPSFDASPSLRGVLLDPARDERGRNTILHRLFPGGSLKLVAAKAPRNLRRHSARVLLVDEADACEVGAEGNPIALAEKRTLSFGNRKIIIGSTPLLEETSHVLRAYGQSDQRVFEVPCPECGAFTAILWQHIEFEPRPAFRCPHCEALIDESHKPAMVEAGAWRALKPEVQAHAGFRLNALVSLLPNASWPKLVAEFLQAKGDSADLQVFVNTVLGQGWREQMDETNEDELAARAEPFSLEEIPTEVVALTLGCDVQDDRLEASIFGWSKDGTALALDHRAIWGSPDDDETWRELDEILRQRWTHPNGGALKIDAACIDAGDGGHFDKVCAFCQPRLSRRVFAIKGAAGPGRASIERSRSKRRVLHIVGVDGLKGTILNKLAKGRSIRFSDTLDETYYGQLCSERRVVRYSRGRPTVAFERIPGRRAESLDCAVYAFAARAALRLNLDQREAELSSPTPPSPPPRIFRSKFMESGRL
jgi:phage terminase large subunit GpA-like protein